MAFNSGFAVQRLLTNKKTSPVSTRQSSRLSLHAKYKVEIITLGKRTSKDAVYDDAIAEYVKRMRGTVSFAERHLKRDVALKNLTATHDSGASLILLDAQGLLPRDSRDFAKRVFNALQIGRCRLTFVIGDAEGFPDEICAFTGSRTQALSLSTLTLTHKMQQVRLLLYEQLYRATEIAANSKYHK